MTRSTAPAFFVLFLACASSSSTTETRSTTAVAAAATGGPAEGDYDYVANLPGQQVRGRMRVVGDTVLVDPVADYCRPTVGVPDPLAIRYTCNGPGNIESVELRIDRRNPAQLSKWTAAYRVQRRREVCTQYAIRDGRQVCVQMNTETYETIESRSGTLQVRRVQ
ncbi:MAG TPA: hypothetical protein VF128_12785 [Gemmatimonadaceae bacterium]